MAKRKNDNRGNLGFEQKLWQAADKLKNNMDAAEYKHVVLGLIYLKYISDAFIELYKRLTEDKIQGADPGVLTSTVPRTFSGSPRRPDGSISRKMLSSG